VSALVHVEVSNVNMAEISAAPFKIASEPVKRVALIGQNFVFVLAMAAEESQRRLCEKDCNWRFSQ
jgi:hypothetical protein